MIVNGGLVCYFCFWVLCVGYSVVFYGFCLVVIEIWGKCMVGVWGVVLEGCSLV